MKLGFKQKAHLRSALTASRFCFAHSITFMQLLSASAKNIARSFIGEVCALGLSFRGEKCLTNFLRTKSGSSSGVTPRKENHVSQRIQKGKKRIQTWISTQQLPSEFQVKLPQKAARFQVSDARYTKRRKLGKSTRKGKKRKKEKKPYLKLIGGVAIIASVIILSLKIGQLSLS